MPSAPPQDLESFVSRVQLVGRSGGRVRQLAGFDKSRHSEPDAVNAATSGFLARLCTPELTEEAERFFQRARAGFGYKRKDLALDVSPPAAVLTARDFTFEITYALAERAPQEFVVTKTLHQVRAADVVRRPECDALYAGQFAELVFLLRKSVRVEAVIDAVEELGEESGLRVDYPSDYRDCTLQVEGVAATVTCDGGSLAMQFPRAGSPRELLEAFAAVRTAFALTKVRALAGLLS